jgi:HlyD family secretion protein
MVGTAYRARLHLALVLPALVACAGDEPDAYGNFEATEVVVSAEAAGTLLQFDGSEGTRLARGVTVGQIDTTTLTLQRQELVARGEATRTRAREAEAQIGVLRAQLFTAEEEYQRTLRLFRADAATARQLNQAEGEVRVLRERIGAAQAQRSATQQETGAAEARVAQLSDGIRRARIVNPIAGTVLTTYAEPGEFVQPGQPLYRIAQLDTLTLRAFVSGSQLAGIRTGQPTRVRVDAGPDDLLELPGRVTWIAAEAEFTPTPIQTREERTDQVYAVKVRVPNQDGVLKIGMPGEVVFTAGNTEQTITESAPAGASRGATRQ